ncbi:glycosyltransferase [Lyngbya sp. PCC 8106]|uniref:glycosyltransferase family 2 protein n=1 Tax=Lyngbya sp. (strain PCC 8106) TaxID=313612 RepID=UPI00030C6D2F
MSEAVESFRDKPLISVIMPVYNTSERFLREAIQSVIDQVYPNWELCIADDASTRSSIQPILVEYQAKDSRIKVVFRTQNGHISASSNSALELATGEFIALLDHDDVLTPDALYEVVHLLNQHSEADMIYSDEDKLNEKDQLDSPFFKPDWCPDSFLSRMYTCHLGIYRRELVNQVGNFRIGYEGSQDYDLVLRITEKTDKIFHIPKVLYHWRIHSESAASGIEAKPYAYQAGLKALQDAINRRGENGVVQQVQGFPGHYRVRYKITEYKKVSIIIPTRDLGEILDRCLESIFTKSTYPNYEVILIDNGSVEDYTHKVIAKWKEKEYSRFKCCQLDIPFNYSKLNNYAVSQAKGDYLLFLNNDTEVITSDWIEAMVEQAQRPSIGAVGTLLLYPDDTIQHGGVVIGMRDVAAHSHQYFEANQPGYYGQIASTNNYLAVTAACLMCRREVFERVGGFDEQLAIAYNDVDFCLKLLQQGYRNLYLSHVILYHHESKSRGFEDTPEKLHCYMEEVTLMKQRWRKFIDHDPCYNPNLSLSQFGYSIKQFANVEIQEISSLKASCDEIFDFALEVPQPGILTRINTIQFIGWAIAKDSSIIAMQVIDSMGKVLKTFPCNWFRPDILKRYPDRKLAENCGFCTTIEINQIRGKDQLILQAVLQNGQYILLERVQIKFINPD